MGRNSLAAKHYCIVALPEELGHGVVAVEPEFEVVAAGLEKGPHSPKVLGPQEPPVGSEVEGVERVFEYFEQGENRCSW